MAAPAPALASQQQDPKPQIPPVLSHLLSAAIVALCTWFMTTNRMDAVQETRISTIEKNLDFKASHESVEAMDKRLVRIEDKLDKVLEKKK